MKKILFILLALSPVLFTQCNDNDGVSLGDQWISLATVIRPDEQAGSPFFLRQDNGDVLWAAAPINFPNLPYGTGQRLLINYTYLNSTAHPSAIYDYDVLINGVRTILTKKPSVITTEVQNDSVGNDSFREILGMEIGSDYLNVNYRMIINNKRHLLSLIVDERTGAAPAMVGDTLNIYLRQNAFGDNDGYIYRDLVCFNLVPLRRYAAAAEDRLYLKVHVDLDNGQSVFFKGLYNWGNPSSVDTKYDSTLFEVTGDQVE